MSFRRKRLTNVKLKQHEKSVNTDQNTKLSYHNITNINVRLNFIKFNPRIIERVRQTRFKA